MRLHMMPLEKIKVNVMTSKINSGGDRLVPVCPRVKTHGEVCEVLGQSHAMEILHMEIHPENSSCASEGCSLEMDIFKLQ